LYFFQVLDSPEKLIWSWKVKLKVVESIGKSWIVDEFA